MDAIPVNTNGCGTLVTTDQPGVPRPQGSAKCEPGELTPFLWLPSVVR